MESKLGASHEVFSHIEFWTQFREYLEDHKIQIRLSKPSNRSSNNVFLPRSYFRLTPRHLLENNQLDVAVQFGEPGAVVRYELVVQQHQAEVNEHLSPLGTLHWKPLEISFERFY